MSDLTVNPEAKIILVGDRTVIISTNDAVIFKHAVCGGTLDVFSHDAKQDLPWMQTCHCFDTTNAPHTGGDTVPLVEPADPGELLQPNIKADPMPLDAVFRLVNRKGEA